MVGANDRRVAVGLVWSSIGSWAVVVGLCARVWWDHSQNESLRVELTEVRGESGRITNESRSLSARVDALERASAATAQDRDARARFLEGVQAYDAGNYGAARDAFQRAYEIRPNPGVLVNLAWACVQSGHADEAERHFTDVLASSDATTTERERAKEGLASLHPSEDVGTTMPPPVRLGTATAQPTSAAPIAEGFLNINSIPPSTVILDGSYLGTTPRMHIAVKPGAHTVQFVGASAATSMTVTVGPGETRTAAAKLTGQVTP